jgi:hypothetical protein
MARLRGSKPQRGGRWLLRVVLSRPEPRRGAGDGGVRSAWRGEAFDRLGGVARRISLGAACGCGWSRAMLSRRRRGTRTGSGRRMPLPRTANATRSKTPAAKMTRWL